jgi:hypothetical protein
MTLATDVVDQLNGCACQFHSVIHCMILACILKWLYAAGHTATRTGVPLEGVNEEETREARVAGRMDSARPRRQGKDGAPWRGTSPRAARQAPHGHDAPRCAARPRRWQDNARGKAARFGHPRKTAWIALEDFSPHAHVHTAVLASIEVLYTRPRGHAAHGSRAPRT